MSQLFRRKWRVLISKDGTTCLDISKLDIKFNISKSLGDNGNAGQITIYNLSKNSTQSQITVGSRVLIEAGYQQGQYGMIFDGDTIDYRAYKDGQVDRVIEISAKDGDVFLNGTFVSQSFAAGMTTAQLLASFVGQGNSGIELGEITPSLLGVQLPRGKVMHGQPGQLLDNLAKSEGGRAFICDRKIHLIKADDPPTGQIVSLTPQSGLVGTPEQTEDGIKAKCLLNPVLNLNKFVHIKSEYVSRSLMKVGDSELAKELPGEGIYKIIKLTHTGDTNANDWYTELIGVAQPGLSPVGLANLIK